MIEESLLFLHTVYMFDVRGFKKHKIEEILRKALSFVHLKNSNLTAI